MTLTELITQDVRKAIEGRANLERTIMELERKLHNARRALTGAVEEVARAKRFARSYFGDTLALGYGESIDLRDTDADARREEPSIDVGSLSVEAKREILDFGGGEVEAKLAACQPHGWETGAAPVDPQRNKVQGTNGEWTSPAPGDSK